MNNLRATIELLFKKENPNKLLKKDKLLKAEKGKDKSFFSSAYSYENPLYYNADEIENVHDLLETNWKKLEYVKNDTVFNVLANFTKHVLLDEKGEPIVKYDMLLKWRQLSYQLGEDLLTSAYFAYNDFVESYERTIFAWKPIITTNNKRLKAMLEKGSAENHFHLKGSAPHFQLSWISLMNNITGREEEFGVIEKELRLMPNVDYSFDNSQFRFKVLIKKASLIRMFLFKELILNEEFIERKKLNKLLKKIEDLKTDDKQKEELQRKIDKIRAKESHFNETLNSETNSEINLFLNEVQQDINFLKYEYGKKFDSEIPDYAIPENVSRNNYNHKENQKHYNGNILLYGERFFLYTVLKKIYSGDKKALKYMYMFHAYIVIKERFRDEFIQINKRVGFANFATYQNRKGFFLSGIYEDAVINMAVNASVYDQNIESLEARIAPGNIEGKIKGSERAVYNNKFYDLEKLKHEEILAKWEKQSKISKNEAKHFYTVHFTKLAEKYCDAEKAVKKNKYKEMVQPINAKERKTVKKQAFEIIEMRKKSSETKKKLLGIDAANVEIGCRPEVFAQAFRYLREYNVKNEFENFDKDEIHDLGVTYHAGEDFFCIIDGLRAIDETIRFLGYRQGDRLGHALALGINPHDYYEVKKYSTIFPKQLYLDNCAWLLAKISEYNIKTSDSLKSKLKSTYFRLYSEIYDDILGEEVSYQTYYNAWKLRGDNPEYYMLEKDKKQFNKRPSFDFWEKCGIDFRKEELKELRKNNRICELYMNYHYNPQVRLNGMKSEVVKVSHDFIELTVKLQRAMQYDIARRNICIESNPSSNYVIGTFKRYDEHPLTKFYNLGLTYNQEELDECPQLSVSINTDDQGVFATYLENEYALMALALEKKLDEDGNSKYKPAMVYDWLDRVRQMGLEQSFKNRVK